MPRRTVPRCCRWCGWGLVDERAGALAERLRHWQWPDGGWNCHGKPDAQSSSVYETLLPLRGLAAYGQAYGDTRRV